MFSINLKRSVVTLTVVAGLLAAAGPASAQVMPGMIGVTTPDTGRGLGVATSEAFELNTVRAGAPVLDNKAATVIVPDGELSLLKVASGESPQVTSLGRENSIECLLRAEASDEGQAQSRKPAPLGITLCHEGFEIQ